MKISASIFSNSDKSPVEISQELEHFQIDYLHVDCCDDISVFDEIAKIRKVCRTPIDLHVITGEPNRYYDLIRKHNIELIAFQHEQLNKPLHYPKDLAARLGIAFTSETPVEEFEFYKDSCSFLLFMTTTPGQSGGVFDHKTFERIRLFKKLYPYKNIHVDGGVNDEISFALRNSGVHCAISGSYLVQSADLPISLMKLKCNNAYQDFPLYEFMLRPNELPVIDKKDVNSFESILHSMESSKLGFCLVVDKTDMSFIGAITDGDIRRALLKNIKNLENLLQLDLVNKNPITVKDNMTIRNMLDLISKYRRPLLFLPVINDSGCLVGAISFNNLIKGEL